MTAVAAARPAAPATRARRPWIRSPRFDLAFILAPPFAAVLLAAPFAHGIDTPPWAWVLLVLGLDVGHVYATLYRSYWDPAARAAKRLRAAMALIPAAGWLAGTFCYALGERAFWSGLAYLAVFHFIRQQYGFLRLYGRGDPDGWGRRLDAALLYLCTAYPVLWWHAHLPRAFWWFLPGDFRALPAWPSAVCGWAYLGCAIAYIAKEARAFSRGRGNAPKQLLLAGTALSWYCGIVAWNGDLAFTVINVAAHAIPYYALVWDRRGKDGSAAKPRAARTGARAALAVMLFLAPLILFAWIEEGLWDGWFWREHPRVFAAFTWLPPAPASVRGWLAPLLALPQITHYVLDAFLWRMKPATGRRILDFVPESV